MPDIPEHLIWEPSLSVGVAILDEQHKQFIEAINLLLDAIRNKEIYASINTIFDKLLHYQRVHFATEEGFFDKVHYEGAAAHKLEHAKFAKELDRFHAQFAKGEIEASFELIDFLEDWLISHLSEYDQKYVECFHQHGLK